MQLYLYMGTMKFGSSAYPLFYIPITVHKDDNGRGYLCKFTPHIYANKRALDFALQELGKRQAREWLNPVKDRINYLKPEENYAEVAEPLFRKIATALDLGGQVDLIPGRPKEASNTLVSLSSALYIAVFERSDEALLNDYEEIISQARNNAPGVVQLFEGIIQGALFKNPQSIHAEVESSWDSLPVSDRMVIDSPVPLNEEQIKVINAIRSSSGKIIVVEGPPGTGKSHTITAIAADCALQGKSCLVLSDKTEALDVVQSKLSAAMSQARPDDTFPNPILRIGQDQTNFRRLTGQQALTQVSAFAKASKAAQPMLEAEVETKKSRLKDQINQTMEVFGSLTLGDIAHVQKAESLLRRKAPSIVAAGEKIGAQDLQAPLSAALQQSDQLMAWLRAARTGGDLESEQKLWRRARLEAAAASASGYASQNALATFNSLSGGQVKELGALVLEFEQLRMPLFGYLFRGSRLKAMERHIQTRFEPVRPVILRTDSPQLKKILDAAPAIERVLKNLELDEEAFSAIYALLTDPRDAGVGKTAFDLVFMLRSALPSGLPTSLFGGRDEQSLEALWIEALEYFVSLNKTYQTFRKAPQFEYAATKESLEKLSVTAMNAEVDNRLVNFMQNHRTDARVLANIIKERQKFPEDKFSAVKDAFPIIIANIRQFGEYMPLAPDLFDVVIIDEASQVSVAQAFPAMLRAKKIVVLGDSKQFSNTKSTNASIALNTKYRSDLEAFFRAQVSQDASLLHRLSYFDVKRSVLEFASASANYSVMLRKHFRSYKELISYSSVTFYGGQLQAIKIRGEPLGDVIRFDEVDASKSTVTRVTNEAEADFILKRLIELIEGEEEDLPTVGVITPFRQQQVLLSKKLFGHARGAEFQARLKLKVMTFDSCQGEERQIIFYSMVATPHSDALAYIFPVELADAEENVEEKLKMQRLNVGFSRAEETIWFVTSKPVNEFRGSIGKVLAHYSGILERGDRDAKTDPNSPMEKRVLEWLDQTPFVQMHSDEVEIIPQFPIGDYLRQLDPTYVHPAWRVDFLLTYQHEGGTTHVVIEYDGFEYHFQKNADVNVGNHSRYMVEADVERQLVLESYGFRFLRINRFNLGKDPVSTLNDRLIAVLGVNGGGVDDTALDEMQSQASGLINGDMKTCAKCGAIKPHTAYFDRTLKDGVGGYGRICVSCKAAAQKPPRSPSSKSSFKRQRRWRRY